MTALIVSAELASPPVMDHPPMLDALLYAGIGASLGREQGGYSDPDQVYAMRLPLDRVKDGPHWWWAASAAMVPESAEAIHTNRRPPQDAYQRWTSDRSYNRGVGADKALRIPRMLRWQCRRLEWTCAGDRDEVARLLAHVPNVGRLGAHGYGWVRRWHVQTVAEPDDRWRFGTVQVRHVPVRDGDDLRPGLVRRTMAIRPPYYPSPRQRRIPCWTRVLM